MDFNFFSIFILVIFILWMVQVFNILFKQKSLSKRTLFNYIAATFLAIGAVGFFGSALSATAGRGKSETFEWPIGSAEGALELKDGTYIVPHTESGRIQVYSQSLDFIIGWYVKAGGGTYRLIPNDGNTFYVYTARGNMKYLYNTKGELLSSERYTDNYPKESPEAIKVWIPTPFYLLIFSSPFYPWLIGVIGGFILYFNNKDLLKTQ